MKRTIPPSVAAFAAVAKRATAGFGARPRAAVSVGRVWCPSGPDSAPLHSHARASRQLCDADVL
jgi:hypothetical protein